MYQFIRYEVNGGHSVRGKWWPYRLLWFDDWLKMDKVIDITGAVGTCYLGVACNARVRDAVLDSN